MSDVDKASLCVIGIWGSVSVFLTIFGARNRDATVKWTGLTLAVGMAAMLITIRWSGV